MKTSRILKLMGVVLIGLFLTTQVDAKVSTRKDNAKKAIAMTIDKPMIEIMAKAYGKEIDAKDIVRLQKFLSQVDHITITFNDKDASDYVLKFKPIDEQELEAWMFDAGYLSSDYQTDSPTPVPWMQEMEEHLQ